MYRFRKERQSDRRAYAGRQFYLDHGYLKSLESFLNTEGLKHCCHRKKLHTTFPAVAVRCG